MNFAVVRASSLAALHQRLQGLNEENHRVETGRQELAARAHQAEMALQVQVERAHQAEMARLEWIERTNQAELGRRDAQQALMEERRETQRQIDRYQRLSADQVIAVQRREQASQALETIKAENSALAAVHATLQDEHRQLVSEQNLLKERCDRAELGQQQSSQALAESRQLNDTLVAQNRELLAASESLNRLVSAHAELMEQHHQLRDQHRSLSDRCHNAELGHQALAGMYNELAASSRHRLFAKTGVPEGSLVNDGIRRIAELLSPREALGHHKIRLGAEGDGGYVMLDSFEGIEVAYSLGVGDNASWDLALAQRGVKVFQFDHTIETAPIAHPNLHFLKNRIVPLASAGTEDLRSILRFSPSQRAVLKMDIEHDEWAVLDQVDPETLAAFTQIVCEFHGFDQASDTEWRTRATRVLEKLNARHQLVHLHANNCGPYALVGGIPIPSMLEATFASRERYEFGPTSERFPGPLDRPNNPGGPDYSLDSFLVR